MMLVVTSRSILAVVERRHDVLELARRQAAVGDPELDLGHQLAQLLGELALVLDARADVEGLAAAVVLAQDRLAQDHRVGGQDEGAHRETVDRRRGDDAELLQAAERHLQGARDRRRGHRQHVHLGAQLLQLLLVHHAEVLLLVDHDEAEIAESDLVAEQRMRADHDVDVARGQALADLGDLLGRHEARDLLDAQRQAGKALAHHLEMLAHQQRGRREDRHLLAGHRDHERRAQRHLGLAEADVAADQPVHRMARGEIVEHRLDRALLILGLVVGEARGELLVQAGRRHDQGALAHRPPGRDLDQLARDLADALLDLGLARLPAEPAQLVQLDRAVGRAVARQHVQVLDRHEQLVAALIDQAQAVVRRAGEAERDQPVEAADAVVAMHHQIALAERCDLGDELVGAARPAHRPGSGGRRRCRPRRARRHPR